MKIARILINMDLVYQYDKEGTVGHGLKTKDDWKIYILGVLKFVATGDADVTTLQPEVIAVADASEDLARLRLAVQFVGHSALFEQLAGSMASESFVMASMLWWRRLVAYVRHKFAPARMDGFSSFNAANYSDVEDCDCDESCELLSYRCAVAIIFRAFHLLIWRWWRQEATKPDLPPVFSRVAKRVLRKTFKVRAFRNKHERDKVMETWSSHSGKFTGLDPTDRNLRLPLGEVLSRLLAGHITCEKYLQSVHYGPHFFVCSSVSSRYSRYLL